MATAGLLERKDAVKLSWNGIVIGLMAACFATQTTRAADTDTARWTPEQAKTWYAQQRWLVGSNFVPKSAINELEMWQADTFDLAEIDKELGWAQSIGMNTMRVFLHDLLWKQDAEGFKKRIDAFLNVCQKHKIKPLLVLFDSCWDPNPKLGKQHDPRPGVHNSGWVKSPGDQELQDPAEVPHFEAYTKGIVGAFANDDRILGWDVWNEPDNSGGGKYDHLNVQKRIEIIGKLLPQVFAWARSVHPTQPLTSGPWHDESWAPGATLNAVEQAQLDNSDVLTFHSYDPPAKFESHIKQLQPYGRPMICTEYMARPMGSTFGDILPIARKYDVGMINWGFVQGRSQTNMPWDSWDHPYVKAPPKVWFHDIFYPNGKPYRQEEVDLIKKMTSEAAAEFKKP